MTDMAARRAWRLAGLLVLALSAAPLARHYLVKYPQEIWQVDLQVYREGAKALVTGFPLYEMRTDAPQFLPFTYPPFAALAGLPLLVLPFHGIAWAWTVLQFALLWYTVGVAFRPFLERFGARGGLVQGVLAAGGVWLLPVAEGIRYGQVNCVIVALCLWDVTRRATVDRGGSGVGVALAAAVKLTPGVFWLHWAVARRWRTLAVSLGTVVGVTAGSFLLMPNESMVYFTDALTDPGRLGPNAGTSNQSLRGTLLRIGPAGLGGSLLWLAAVVVVLYLGLRLSRRLDALGEPVAVVAACGMLAYLVSPVSWVHHMHWIVVVLGALLGDGRDRRRVVATVVGAVLFWCRLPWWGANLLAGDAVPNGLARVVQSSYTELAVVALLALWFLVARPRRGESVREPEEPAVTLGS